MVLKLNKHLRYLKEHIANENETNVGAGPVSARKTNTKHKLNAVGVDAHIDPPNINQIKRKKSPETEGVKMMNNLKIKNKINIKIMVSMVLMLLCLFIMPNKIEAALDVDSLTWGSDQTYTGTNREVYTYMVDSTNTYAWIKLCQKTGATVAFPNTINGLEVVVIDPMYEQTWCNIFGKDEAGRSKGYKIAR